MRTAGACALRRRYVLIGAPVALALSTGLAASVSRVCWDAAPIHCWIIGINSAVTIDRSNVGSRVLHSHCTDVGAGLRRPLSMNPPSNAPPSANGCVSVAPQLSWSTRKSLRKRSCRANSRRCATATLSLLSAMIDNAFPLTQALPRNRRREVANDA